LEAYHPQNAEEEDYLGRMLMLCGSRNDPFSRAHFAPGHFTASAFILSPDEDALLLIFHQKLRRWLQPGGHVEADDPSMLAAAQREAREEVGLDALPLLATGIFDLDIHEIPARGPEPAHDHFDVRFLFLAQAREAHAASDAEEARWFPLSSIDDRTSDRSVLRAVRRLISR
jgi:8-oxo-dGTP pyrophosphatase MutT (NUDIX family)